MSGPAEDPAPTSTPTEGRPKRGPKAAKTARLLAVVTDDTRPANERLKAIRAVWGRVHRPPPQRTEHMTIIHLPDGRVIRRARVTEG
jgi:hypothetical protein